MMASLNYSTLNFWSFLEMCTNSWIEQCIKEICNFSSGREKNNQFFDPITSPKWLHTVQWANHMLKPNINGRTADKKIWKIIKTEIHIHGCGLLGTAMGGNILAITKITRSWVAFNVATASSCVTFSRFFSPCCN